MTMASGATRRARDIGIADEAVSSAAAQYGGGVVFAGLVPGRADDAFGVYATLCDLSDEPAAGFGSDGRAVSAAMTCRPGPFIARVAR